MKDAAKCCEVGFQVVTLLDVDRTHRQTPRMLLRNRRISLQVEQLPASYQLLPPSGTMGRLRRSRTHHAQRDVHRAARTRVRMIHC